MTARTLQEGTKRKQLITTIGLTVTAKIAQIVNPLSKSYINFLI